MNRDSLIAVCDAQLMNVRNEFSHNQITMSHILGISKKTLVDIEKGRRSLGWSGSIALIALFPTSQALTHALGTTDTLALAQSLMLDGIETTGRVTHGGGWWAHVENNDYCTVEQNVISQHYRLVDSERRHIASSLSYEDIHALFLNHTTQNMKQQEGLS